MVALPNGVQYPQLAVPGGWVRSRLLNECNARTIKIALSDQRPIYVIASDGGLLTEPVKISALEMMAGERFEIMIETNHRRVFDLVTLSVKQMGMTLPPFDQPLPLVKILPLAIGGVSSLPDQLATLPPLPATDKLTRRRLTLSMDKQLDQQGMQQLMERYGGNTMAGRDMHPLAVPLQPDRSSHNINSDHRPGDAMPAATPSSYDYHQENKINGQAYQPGRIAWDVEQNCPQVWEIDGNGDMMLHPFHIHGTQFRILSENGQPVAAHRQGWKDMVRVEGDKSEVLVSFPHTASPQTPYMAHCHLLEHEDTGMMISFTVSGRQSA